MRVCAEGLPLGLQGLQHAWPRVRFVLGSGLASRTTAESNIDLNTSVVCSRESTGDRGVLDAGGAGVLGAGALDVVAATGVGADAGAVVVEADAPCAEQPRRRAVGGCANDDANPYICPWPYPYTNPQSCPGPGPLTLTLPLTLALILTVTLTLTVPSHLPGLAYMFAQTDWMVVAHSRAWSTKNVYGTPYPNPSPYDSHDASLNPTITLT